MEGTAGTGDVRARALGAATYLVVALGSGLVTLVLLPLTLVVALTVLFGGVGLVPLPRWMALMGRWAAWHQGRAARLDAGELGDLPVAAETAAYFVVTEAITGAVRHDYAGELLADGRGGVGYLLKDRAGRVSEFVDALRRVADGGTVMDPSVVRQLLARRSRDPLESLTRRGNEVLGLMAEGQRERRAQTCRQHLRAVGAVALRQRAPPGARGARLPRRQVSGAHPVRRTPCRGLLRRRARSCR